LEQIFTLIRNNDEKSKFSPKQIEGILKTFDQGKSFEKISREHGVSRQTFYQYRKKQDGMEAKKLKEIKKLGSEKARFKKLSSNLALDLYLAKYFIKKNS
jgi:putative transposase